MTQSEVASAVVLEMAEEFLARYRAGERPSLREYILRRPEYEAMIRELFPAMAMMENIAISDESLAGPTAASSNRGSHLPESIGEYRILREIGHGGMGIVYEAEQVSLGRHVALKVLLHQAINDDRQRHRFEREAKAAAKLHHTNIVPVFGVGDHQGMPYYVMQYIKGQGLDAVVEELRRLQNLSPDPHGPASAATRTALQPLPSDADANAMARSLVTGVFIASDPPEITADPPRSSPPSPSTASNETKPIVGVGTSTTLNIPGHESTPKRGRLNFWQSVAHLGAQVADGLEYAHRQGVLHRDIKPSNLLLDTRGIVWITDFGLAKLEDQQNLTHTGDILGTLRYMPPEAFEGKADARSDVYSLGLTLYELVALRYAFDESDRAKLLRQVTNADVPGLRKLNRAIPRDLETIIHKAIERDPTRRYQTAGDLAADLERFVNDQPIQARRIATWERLWRWAKHNPTVAGLAASLVAVVLMGLLLVTVQWQKAIGEREEKEQQRGKAVDAKNEAERERIVARDKQDIAEASFYSSLISRARLELQANQVGTAQELLDRCDEKRRGWEWHFLKAQLHADLFTLEGQKGWVNAVAVSPDGTQIAAAGGGNPFHATQRSRRWPGEVLVWDARTGERLRILIEHEHLLHALAYRPDGKVLASGCAAGRVVVYDAQNGTVQKKIETGTHEVTHLFFSATGNRMVVLLSSGHASVFDATTFELQRTMPVFPNKCTAGALSSDGQRLVAARLTTLKVVDLTTGQDALTLEHSEQFGHNGVRSAAIAPNGKYIAAGSDEGIRMWDFTTGKTIRNVARGDSSPQALQFSPDGRYLAGGSDDTSVRVWSLATWNEVRTYRGHTNKIHALAFTPDGAQLVSGGTDSLVKVWDMTTHAEYRTLDAPHEYRTVELDVFGFSNSDQQLTMAQRGGMLRSISITQHTLSQQQYVPFSSDWMTPAERAYVELGGNWVVGLDAQDDRVARCFNIHTGAERVLLKGHTQRLAHVTATPGAKRIATAGPQGIQRNQAAEVKVWDAVTGKVLYARAEPNEGVTRLALSPDGATLAVAGYALRGDDSPLTYVKLIDIATGKQLDEIDGGGDPLFGVVFDQHGKRLAAVGGNKQTIILYDCATYQTNRSKLGPPAAMDVQFHPDGQRLAVAGRPYTKIIDVRSGEEMLTLRTEKQKHINFGGYSPRARFSGNGHWLAVYGDSISLWNAAPDSPTKQTQRREAAHKQSQTWHLIEAQDEAGYAFHIRETEKAPLNGAWEYFCRAGLYAKHNAFAKAEADIKTGLTTHATSAEYRLQCGLLYARCGHEAQALLHAQEALARNPASRMAWEITGLLLLKQGDVAGYRALAKKMLTHFGDTSGGHPLMFLVVFQMLQPGQNVPEAMHARLREALKDQPQHDFTNTALGLLAWRAGKLDEAVQHFTVVMNKTAKDSFMGFVSGYGLAAVRQLQGKTDEARQLFAQAATIHKNYVADQTRYLHHHTFVLGSLYGQLYHAEVEKLLKK